MEMENPFRESDNGKRVRVLMDPEHPEAGEMFGKLDGPSGLSTVIVTIEEHYRKPDDVDGLIEVPVECVEFVEEQDRKRFDFRRQITDTETLLGMALDHIRISHEMPGAYGWGEEMSVELKKVITLTDQIQNAANEILDDDDEFVKTLG
jgi:hypothetical protein